MRSFLIGVAILVGLFVVVAIIPADGRWGGIILVVVLALIVASVIESRGRGNGP